MARVGRRFREALDYAATLHEKQRRKQGSDDPTWIPYVSHLLGVASLVLGDVAALEITERQRRVARKDIGLKANSLMRRWPA